MISVLLFCNKDLQLPENSWVNCGQHTDRLVTAACALHLSDFARAILGQTLMQFRIATQTKAQKGH